MVRARMLVYYSKLKAYKIALHGKKRTTRKDNLSFNVYCSSSSSYYFSEIYPVVINQQLT